MKSGVLGCGLLPRQPLSARDARRKVLGVALLSRVILLISMILSDGLIPDHNPGDDVERFHLRLDSDCFCLQRHACDGLWRTRVPKDYGCASQEEGAKARPARRLFYGAILSPLAKWDAARFLNLALDPWRRNPPQTHDENLLAVSEQSHAFFPLLPILTRYLSLFLVRVSPVWILPPTFEAVLVLSAALINLVAFCLAALALFELTLTIGANHVSHAFLAASLFCVNPAGVFFSSNYSESTFCMWTFWGYALWHRNRCFAVLVWMAASATRSNGSLLSGWLCLWGMSQCIAPSQNVSQRLRQFLLSAFSVMLVALPGLYHDEYGRSLFCDNDNDNDNDDASSQPAWCHQSGAFRSLYAHVQRKHWNVGFLRYYEWKQIPNFLLALPILALSAMASWTWIAKSFVHYQQIGKNPNAKNKIPTPNNSVLLCLRWAVFALRESSSETVIDNDDPQPLTGPTLLPHYAVLAVVAFIGLTVAHVQISTRLICSTCPAIYWYLASLIIQPSPPKYPVGW
eukprot:CAMPEP_0116833184 /NCGR_PEP_ID=MMETSP0418-20121206/6297_1 /TAXON_ID=1158023 /ORGANISM="Astrosyne radiata, Strain 13vi08-1A" /LENGTH=513 /DNA_ID=CAMNT_0004462609 /DNA_START=132 /DNA_END=1670 /DNA_ORIENTATION=+